MSEWDDVKLGLQYATDSRKAEIGLLWSRSLYFWGLITILLGAYGASFQSGHKTLATLAGCFGVLSSLSWALANRSSKHWQEVWEKKTEEWEVLAVKKEVLHHCLFNADTNKSVDTRWFWGAKPYSPSKLVMVISDFSVIGWIMLVVGTIVSRIVPTSWNVFVAWFGTLAALALTIMGIIVLLFWSRTGEPVGFQVARSVMRQSPRRVRRWLNGVRSS